ncbi:MAG: hypothetical protein LQ340_006410 [Diploschistes diacapsis]|nr:MAG: hypothetical protein LQ340_006410 [Diploschistes diacapsis]
MPDDNALTAALIIISDTASKDPSTDRSRAALESVFREQTNVQWTITSSQIIPDEEETIKAAIESLCDESKDPRSAQRLNLILTTGGTGFAKKDVTPEAVEPLLQRKAPGLV